MNPDSTRRLDPRAWLIWGLAASLPALVGRNPLPLAATLLAVLGVRAAWSAVTPTAVSWRGLVRLALVFATIGAIFNLLTARAGDREIARLPDQVPLFGGALTLNALVYGLLSGFALLTLVLVGTTLGSVLDWSALLRLMPQRLTTVAVAGSVAFAFVPQTAAAFREIREAQAARGYRPRGARDLVPLLVPLLTGGLERAVTLAEALESRAFGAPLSATTDRGSWRGVATALSLTGAVSSGYLLAVGRPLLTFVVFALSGTVLFLTLRVGRGQRIGRTSYRPLVWSRADTLVAATAALAIAATVAALAVDAAALRYEPYPSLALPRVNLGLLTALGLLLVPAITASPPSEAEG